MKLIKIQLCYYTFTRKHQSYIYLQSKAFSIQLKINQYKRRGIDNLTNENQQYQKCIKKYQNSLGQDFATLESIQQSVKILSTKVSKQRRA